jgi:CubicO group peptidase (beta-lactamase class C family)
MASRSISTSRCRKSRRPRPGRTGRWDGSQLISENWIAEATSRQIDTANQQSNPDWRQGYGFQFWMSRHGYRGDGAYGQFCVILPE